MITAATVMVPTETATHDPKQHKEEVPSCLVFALCEKAPLVGTKNSQKLLSAALCNAE